MIFLQLLAQDSISSVSVIPQPVSLQTSSGEFELQKLTAIEVNASDSQVRKIADSLAKKLSNATGYNIPVMPLNKPSGNPGTISFTNLFYL